MISVLDIHKRFGNVQALAGLSFDAKDGEITGVLGSNGAGKSTALRIICGVLRPDRGAVQVDGIASNHAQFAIERKLGAVLDHSGLYSYLTAREHLSYFAQLRGVRDNHVQKTIDTLGMENISDRRSAGFSQGERMKTALGRALVHCPQNIVLDEPTNGLDIPARRTLGDLLKRFRDQGACILFSSHVMEEVRSLCDRTVIIARGREVAHGTSCQICERADASSFEDAYLRLTC